MKKKIFLALFSLFIVVITLTFFSTKYIYNKIIHEKVNELYKHRIVEFDVMTKKEKEFLVSFAEYLSHADFVIKAYLKNDPNIIIKNLKPLYDSLHKRGLIEELHFFKKHTINFVALSSLNTKNNDVSKIRQDIVWVETSFTPSVHFYVCRNYPGLRATYPVIYKDKLLGAFSFGANIEIFREIFKSLGADASIYLNKKILYKYLNPLMINYYASFKDFKNYKVIGEVFDVNLNTIYEVKNKALYTKIPIKDFFGNIMAYIVIKDDLRDYINTLNKNTQLEIGIHIFSFIAVFIIVFLLFKAIFNRLEQLNHILELIKKKEFDKIPPKTEVKDDCDRYKNNVIEVAQDLKLYIDALTKKINDYSTKAYQDGLTKVFNRNFLEEKQHEIFLKYKLSQTPLGIIMLDIDNFKQINDTYGHDIGDLVLVTLAKTIKHLLRKNDIFIRYGGEEFLILLDDTELEDTYLIAEKIRKAIENTKVHTPNGDIKFTISLGITTLKEEDNSLFDAIKRADENLYKAKKSGKNRVIL